MRKEITCRLRCLLSEVYGRGRVERHRREVLRRVRSQLAAEVRQCERRPAETVDYAPGIDRVRTGGVMAEDR